MKLTRDGLTDKDASSRSGGLMVTIYDKEKDGIFTLKQEWIA